MTIPNFPMGFFLSYAFARKHYMCLLRGVIEGLLFSEDFYGVNFFRYGVILIYAACGAM